MLMSNTAWFIVAILLAGLKKSRRVNLFLAVNTSRVNVGFRQYDTINDFSVHSPSEQLTGQHHV